MSRNLEDLEEPESIYTFETLQRWGAPWFDWKASVTERTGISFGLDYSALYLASNNDAGNANAAGGMVRFFGSWDLLGRGTKNTGTLLFRVDNRHRLDTVPVRDFAGELGYAGIIGTRFYPPPGSNHYALLDLDKHKNGFRSHAPSKDTASPVPPTSTDTTTLARCPSSSPPASKHGSLSQVRQLGGGS